MNVNIKVVKIGADIGNSDTKTQHEIVASGFQEYFSLPFGATDYIKYNGKYYVIDESRMPYQEDKTTNNYFLIMLLFGIAKEIIFQFRRKNEGKLPSQDDINQYGYVKLGIGLPPKHFYLKEKTLEYCETVFKEGIQFEYKNLTFDISLKSVHLFPQGVSIILAKKQLNLDLSIPNDYSDYVAVDIGSFTIITSPFEAGKPNPAKNDVFEMGVFCMCDSIISHVKDKSGITLKRMQVISVLQNKKSVLSDEIVEYIETLAKEWTERILNELRQRGLEFRSTPVIFMGGGGQLLKTYINNSSMIGVHEFINDVHMNAKAYSKLLEIYDKE